MHYPIVAPCLLGIRSKTSSGHVKRDGTESYIYACFFPTHAFSLKGNTLWLLFGISELLASLLLCFGVIITLLSKVRVT